MEESKDKDKRKEEKPNMKIMVHGNNSV